VAAFPRLLYHFLRAEDPHAQARNFRRAVGQLFPRERAVVDFETFPDGSTPTVDQLVAFLKDCQANGPHKPRHRHRYPGVYSGLSRWETVLIPSGKLPPVFRWVAAFPGPVNIRHRIHQDSDHDPISLGDHDVFNGSALRCRLFFAR
jgi:hypothetical protein